MVKENTHYVDLMVFIPLSALLILIIPVTILPIQLNTLSTKFVIATSDDVEGEGEVNIDTEGEERDEISKTIINSLTVKSLHRNYLQTLTLTLI